MLLLSTVNHLLDCIVSYPRNTIFTALLKCHISHILVGFNRIVANIFNVFLNLSRYVSEQYTLMYVVCSSSSWTNLFFHNKSYLLTNVVTSKVVSSRTYWARPVIVPLLEPFYEVCCMHVGKSVLNFCLSHGGIIKSPSLLHHLQLWETKEVMWC